MAANNNNQFIVWKVYQRRAESIGQYLDLQINYFHYPWEEKSKIHKAFSYLIKMAATVAQLIRQRPSLVVVQLPPTPALYMTALYCGLTGTPYIADCHNAMFMGHWIRWPLARTLLRKAVAVLVHNQEVKLTADRLGVATRVMRDPLPRPVQAWNSGVLEKFGLTQGEYVIAPWNLAADEPIGEFIEAVRALPDVPFDMTWYAERMPERFRNSIPPNLVLTGYLESNEFNELFQKSGAAISLTIREGTQPSAASEAIAFDVPLILSDMETARTLYGEGAAYVDNTPESIVSGVREVMSHRSLYAEKLEHLRETLQGDLESEINAVISQIESRGRKE